MIASDAIETIARLIDEHVKELRECSEVFHNDEWRVSCDWGSRDERTLLSESLDAALKPWTEPSG